MAINFFNSLSVDTDVLYVDAANDRVGINTSSPSYDLHVSGTTYSNVVRSQRYYGSSGTSSYLDLDSGAPYSLLASSEINVTNSIVCNDLTATEVDGIAATNGPVYGLRFYGYGNTTYYVDPNDSTTSAILNGKVGIGTTSPGAKPHARDSSTSPGIIIESDGGNEQFVIKRYSNTNEQLILGFHSSDYGTIQAVEQGVAYRNLALNALGGNVGIGTTSPDRKLHVNSGSTNIVATFESTDSTAAISLQDNSTSNDSKVQIRAIGDDFNIVSGGAERMRIDSSGNVGIANSSPTTDSLAGNGGLVIGNGSGNKGITIYGSTTSQQNIAFTDTSSSQQGLIQYDHSGDYMRFFTSSSERLRIGSAGQIGIGGANYGTSGQVLTSNGSGSAPSWQNASGSSNWTLSGNDIYNNNSGNVGIGTSSPDQKLHVHKASAGTVSSNSNAIITAENNANGYIHLLVPDANESGILFGNPSSSVNGAIVYNNSGTSNGLQFRTSGNSTKMVINSSGDVGIGEDTIDARLHITTASSGLVNQKFESSGSAAWRIGVPASQTYFAFDNANDNLSSPKVVINSSGNVGIGTTNPFTTGGTAKLTVAGNIISFGSSNSDMSYLRRINAGEFQWQTYNSANTGEIHLQPYGGNVGIGTTSPAEKLEVEGSSAVIKVESTTAGSNANIHFQTTARKSGVGPNMALGSSDFEIYGYTAGSNRLVIDSSGNVGIGTTSPGYKLDVNGAVSTDGGKVVIRDDSIENHVTNGNATIVFNYYGYQTGSTQFRDVAFYNGKLGHIMTIDGSSSSVGIGTTSPSHALGISGTGQASNDFRAPIFYDSNNTGYYVDPASLSVINDLDLKENGIQRWYRSGGSAHQRVDARLDGTDQARMHWYGKDDSQNTRNFKHAWYDGGSYINVTAASDFIYFAETSGTVSVQSDGSFRAPIFYDSNNTAYYVNPASTSVLGGINMNGTLNMQNFNISNVNHITINDPGAGEGIQWNGGNGWQIYESNDSNNNGAGNLQFATGTTHRFRVDTSGNTFSFSSSRAPIFYDSNDTTYYVDPGSTSTSGKFRQFVNIGDSSSYSSNSGTWGARLNVVDDIHARIDVGQDANSMLSSWYAHTGQSGPLFGSMTAHPLRLMYNGSEVGYWNNTQLYHNSSVRAPIFYDSNDTNYYLDPASTSVANTITLDRINMKDKGDYITFYGDDNTYHSITSRDNTGNTSDDLRFNSYHSVYFNLDSNNNNTNSTTGIYVGQHGSGSSTIQNAWSFYSQSDGITFASGSFRAPVFYDSNNTGYYVDPEGTSVMNDINNGSSNGSISYGYDVSSVANTIGVSNWFRSSGQTGWYNGTYAGGVYMIDSTWVRIYNDKKFYTANTSYDAFHTAGGVRVLTQMRSPIYYDENNTGYYADPASTSVFNRIVAGTTSTSNNGSSMHVSGLGSSTNPYVHFAGSNSGYGGIGVRFNNLAYGYGAEFVRNNPYDGSAIRFMYQSSQVGRITINTTSTSYLTTSDYRLKENVIELTDGIERVKQLQPKRFNFIGDEETVDGFIAHEAVEVVPESVTGEKDEVLPNGDPVYQGIDQAKLVPLLTAALQEAITKIEDLETRIQILENQ